MSVSVSFDVNYFRIFPILLIWTYTALQMLSTCFYGLILVSKMHPLFLADVTNVTGVVLLSPTIRDGVATVAAVQLREIQFCCR